MIKDITEIGFLHFKELFHIQHCFITLQGALKKQGSSKIHGKIFGLDQSRNEIKVLSFTGDLQLSPRVILFSPRAPELVSGLAIHIFRQNVPR